MKRLDDESIKNQILEAGMSFGINAYKSVAELAEDEILKQVVDMIDRRISIYMSDAGVKMGYGLAYQVLSELRQGLKAKVKDGS